MNVEDAVLSLDVHNRIAGPCTDDRHVIRDIQVASRCHVLAAPSDEELNRKESGGQDDHVFAGQCVCFLHGRTQRRVARRVNRDSVAGVRVDSIDQ